MSQAERERQRENEIRAFRDFSINLSSTPLPSALGVHAGDDHEDASFPRGPPKRAEYKTGAGVNLDALRDPMVRNARVRSALTPLRVKTSVDSVGGRGAGRMSTCVGVLYGEARGRCRRRRWGTRQNLFPFVWSRQRVLAISKVLEPPMGRHHVAVYAIALGHVSAGIAAAVVFPWRSSRSLIRKHNQSKQTSEAGTAISDPAAGHHCIKQSLGNHAMLVFPLEADKHGPQLVSIR